MPRPPADREAIRDYVNRYVDDTGVRPGARTVAEHLGYSPQTIQAAMAAIDARGELKGEQLRPSKFTDRREECLRAIRSYQLTHGWAPSQREISEMLGCGLQRANATIERLAAEGRVVVGPYPRQLYITGTTVKVPEVKAIK